MREELSEICEIFKILHDLWSMKFKSEQTHMLQVDIFRQQSDSNHMYLIADTADTIRHSKRVGSIRWKENTHVSANRHIQTHLYTADT